MSAAAERQVIANLPCDGDADVSPSVRPLLTAQVEPWPSFYEEAKDLFPGHYEELSLHKGRFPLNPQYDEYMRRHELGSLIVVTLRAAGKLAGYIMGFVAPGLHYRDCLTYSMDIFYVAPEFRGGHGGIRMFRFLEAEAKRRGIAYLVMGSKNHKDTSGLFARLGYDPIETYHAKWID